MTQARRVEVRLNPTTPFQKGDYVWVLPEVRELKPYQAEIVHRDGLEHPNSKVVVRAVGTKPFVGIRWTYLNQLRHIGLWP